MEERSKEREPRKQGAHGGHGLWCQKPMRFHQKKGLGSG